MTAGAGPDDPKLTGVNPVLSGMHANVLHRAGDVVINLRDGRLGLGEVRHGEQRVAAPQECLAHHRLEVIRVRSPGTAHHHYHAEAVGLPGLHELVGQFVIVPLAVDDPFLLGEFGRGTTGGTQREGQP